MKRNPITLFTRTWLTVAAAVLLFLIFSTIIMFYYLVQPMARQSAEDMAALMVLSAQVWVELPPHTRPDFELELYKNHGVTVTDINTETLQRHMLETPYMRFLEASLSQRLGVVVPIKTRLDDERWLWMDIPMAGRELRFGFPHSRIGARPPIVAIWLLLGSVLATLLTSLLLVRKLNHPIQTLTHAAERLGRGDKLDPLPEQGPKEIVTLTRQFNHMMQEIYVLLENRTTLLAGVSHDLRSPIARVRLAIEMLETDKDKSLLEQVKNDLGEMDELIGRTLEFAKGLDSAQKPADLETLNIAELVKEISAEQKDRDAELICLTKQQCLFDANRMVLKRVLGNLIENAVRYSNEAITVDWECDQKQIRISVLDRGPGIPRDQLQSVFQPFYRLEHSRNRDTGGSGLGLTIVEQLCNAYGWSVSLVPRENGGLKATVIIPRHK